MNKHDRLAIHICISMITVYGTLLIAYLTHILDMYLNPIISKTVHSDVGLFGFITVMVFTVILVFMDHFSKVIKRLDRYMSDETKEILNYVNELPFYYIFPLLIMLLLWTYLFTFYY